MDDLSKTVATQGAKAPSFESPALDRMAADMDKIAKGVEDSQRSSSLPALMLLASALLSGFIAYLVAKAVQKGPGRAGDYRSAASGFVDREILKQHAQQDEKMERLGVLGEMRAKLNELETDARNYSGVYSLMLAYRTTRNAPLQRLAEISTREQEALLRYRTAAGLVSSLGYAYGKMPAQLTDPNMPDDLGAWMMSWWNELEMTLEADTPSQTGLEKRNDLFKKVRQKLHALANAERKLAVEDEDLTLTNGQAVAAVDH
jgi:hypothetical protein